MIENSVVLPAPLGPISAVMLCASTSREAESTARSPPKRCETWSTRSSASATAATPDYGSGVNRAQAGVDAGREADGPARSKCHDADKDRAIDREVYTRRVAGNELCRFAEYAH